MGKYDSVLSTLAPLPVSDRPYQDKVDHAKAETTEREPSKLATAYIQARAERKVLDAQVYDVNLRIEALTQLLVESQEKGEEGWGEYGAADNTLRLISGDVVRIQREPYGQVKDKEAFRLWCIENGYASQLMLWPTAMNALVKERLLAGDNPPDGTEAFVKAKPVFTAMKQGTE